MKIALVNPTSPFLINDKVMPPLGLMYLSSYLKAHGEHAEIFDTATNQPIKSGYDIYAITSTTPQYPIALKLLNMIRARNPKSWFVIGGAHASAYKSACLGDGFDSVVIGEGEQAVLALTKNKTWGMIQEKHIENINTIPFPDRSFKGFEDYDYRLNGEKTTTMITSRGCPFKCAFCFNHWGNRVRLRSAENIVAEVKEIQDKYGINAIQFYDDTFTASKQRTRDICVSLKELGTTWRCFIHANTVSKDLLKLMKQSGCIEVGMGVESGNNEILKTVNKRISIEKATETVKMCHEVDMRIKTFLIMGLPGETVQSAEDTKRFIRTARPDDFDINILTPFPGTKIWDEPDKFDIKYDKSTLDFGRMFFKGKYGDYASQVSTKGLSSEQIETIRDEIESLKKET